MICPHCKTQWQLPANSENNFTKCPFCQGDLYEELAGSYTVETALKEIVSRFGVDILSNSSELIFAFGSIAPRLEKEIQGLLLFEACGGIGNFLNLQGAEQEAIFAAYNSQIKQMTAVITDICSGFLAATGISLEIAEQDADEETASNVAWEYVSIGNDTIEITACKEQLPATIVFPGYIDDKKVVSIGSAVLGAAKTKGADRLRVESVHIPHGVLSIGNGAFSGCKALKSISLPKTLSSIGDNAFKNCKALMNMAIPDGVNYIGSGAFSGSGIQSVVLPGNIGTVSKAAFMNCKQLLSVTFLDGISIIQEEAFSGCNSITNIELPDGVTTIETSAFNECKKLYRIILPDSIEYIGNGAFRYCSSLTVINIPPKIKVLEYEVFYGCGGFSSFIIPDQVTQIDEDAFGNCWSLRKITIPKSVEKIENDAFFNMADEITIVCYKDSYAHKWAQKHSIKLELM